MKIAFALLLLTACAGMSGALIKTPLQQQCQGAGLKACPELSEGVALYIDGDKAGSTEQLRVVALSNSPQQVQVAAKAIVALSEIPAARNYAKPFADVAKQLLSMSAHPAIDASAQLAVGVSSTSAPSTTQQSPPMSNPYDAQLSERQAALRSAADRVAVAPVDPSRLETRSTSLTLGGARCSVFGSDALCVRLLDGPFILTDYTSLGGCPDLLYLGAAPLEDNVDSQLRIQPDWLLPVKDSGAFGAHFYVNGGTRLVAAVRPGGKELSRDPRCVITWSGFKPRLLPSRGE
ncbi:MAG TPA: hypothetical protein VHM70_25095 [Polyangiaceae bacterium]|nr:hypothetical protein [Polyangiaceae bacterium]